MLMKAAAHLQPQGCRSCAAAVEVEARLSVRAFPRRIVAQGHVALLFIETQRAVADDQMVDQQDLHALSSALSGSSTQLNARPRWRSDDFGPGDDQARHLDPAGQQA
jgi:hypothetical protein